MAQNLGALRKNCRFLFTRLLLKDVCRNYAKTKPKKENPYILLRARPGDYKETLDLLWDAYFPYEPTASCIGLGRKRNPMLDEEAQHCLAEGVSVIAKCKYTGKIVGGCLNESSTPWDPDRREKVACAAACMQLRHLFHFWAYLQRAPRLWEKFEVQKVMELSHLFVKRSERGRGLAKQLIIASVDAGLDAGYTLMRVDATSYYTAKICDRLNFRLVYELPYCTYMGHDNKPIFNPKSPHRSVKVYVFESTMKLNR